MWYRNSLRVLVVDMTELRTSPFSKRRRHLRHAWHNVPLQHLKISPSIVLKIKDNFRKWCHNLLKFRICCDFFPKFRCHLKKKYENKSERFTVKML